MSDEELYSDDESHPIPFLDKLDVFAEYKTGGGKLIIVAASPLVGDFRTQKRLLRKIENYLGFICSSEFPLKGATRTTTNAEIRIEASAGADPVILDLIERCIPWAMENQVELTVGLGSEPN